MDQEGKTASRFSQPDAYLAAIVESSDDAIISKDLNGIITSWNHGAARIFGYTEAEAVGQPMRLIIPRDRLSEELEIMNTLRRGGRIEHFETVRLAKDGHPVDMSVTISPIFGTDGKIIGISNTSRDISERKKLERELQLRNQKLEQINSEVQDMMNIAAHDLKEPIRGISLKASMLQEDYGTQLGEEGSRKLGDLIRLSQRSHQLIETLLSFSRIGQTAIEEEEVDLNAIIKDIAHLMEERLKEKNAKIKVSRRLPLFKGDKKGVTEVMRNLITNAVIYNDKPEPLIEIGYLESLENTPHGPCNNVFYVKDNGIGIPTEFHREIFRLFKRLPSSKEYSSKGSGMGLALVKKILDQCKGDIWLESESGKGTCFYFTVGDCAGIVFH